MGSAGDGYLHRHAMGLPARNPVFSRMFESHDFTPSALNLYAYRTYIQAMPVKGVSNNILRRVWSGKHGLLFAVINIPQN